MATKKAEIITSRDELYNHLFEACNILRGPINQDEFKSYVTPLLFFKRISDVYDEETKQALEESNGDKEYAAFAENHRFIIPNNCHWSDVRGRTKNIGKAIADAMSGIERANPDTLNGVFTSFDDADWTDKNKLSDERLKNLVEHMSQKKVGNKNYSNDVMGDSYEYLIKKFADLSKKNAAEFYTPRPIVKLLIRLLNPKPGETVYDPACGTGGMLIEAIRHINNDKQTYGKIFGQEKNLATSAIARMNLFLHGAKDFSILQGDTLRYPQHIQGGQIQTFNCTIANPPFSLKSWGADTFANDIYGRNIWGCPTDSCADFAWLQHMIKSMNPTNGRCAVILPQGILFHGNKDGDMRKKLIESDLLEAVITFVGGIFYSTGVSACALILNNNKPQEHKGKVCIIDACEIYKPKRVQNTMENDDINEVLDIYKKYEDKKNKCKIVSIKELKEHGYTLLANAYIEREEQEQISPEVAKKEFLDSYNAVIKAQDEFKFMLFKGGYISDK